MIDLLLQHGAHVDAASDEGKIASDLLPAREVFNHICLHCLAERAVHAHDPPPLPWEFVDRHYWSALMALN